MPQPTDASRAISHPDLAGSPAEVRRIGPGIVLLAYLALCLGMVLVGTASQTADVVLGLWITEALAIALPAVAVLRWAAVRPGPLLGLRRTSWRALLAAAGLSILNQPIVSALTWGSHALLPERWVADFDAKQKMLDAIFAGHALPMLITVTVAAPLGEELFFRGFAFGGARRMGVSWSLLLTSVLFSLLHSDPVGFVGLMEIGALCAALRWATGSLWPAVVAHAVNNALAGAVFLAGWQDSPDTTPTWMVVVGAVLFVAGCALLVRVLRRPSPAPPVQEPVGEPAFSRAAPMVLLWLAAVAAGAWAVLPLLLRR